MVMGIQNYYQLATDISIDCGDIGRTVNTVLKNRLKSGKTHRLKKEGRDLTKNGNPKIWEIGATKIYSTIQRTDLSNKLCSM